MSKLVELYHAIRCLLGYHECVPDINAMFDRCVHCHKRFRAV
jgi:hypothetical protein